MLLPFRVWVPPGTRGSHKELLYFLHNKTSSRDPDWNCDSHSWPQETIGLRADEHAAVQNQRLLHSTRDNSRIVASVRFCFLYFSAISPYTTWCLLCCYLVAIFPLSRNSFVALSGLVLDFQTLIGGMWLPSRRVRAVLSALSVWSIYFCTVSDRQLHARRYVARS